MRVDTVHLLVLISVMGVIGESNGTVLTRLTRTLPFDLSSMRWPGIFQNLLPSGRLWERPTNTAISFIKLLASPDTRKEIPFEFRPEDGVRASYAYQQRYGYRGQWLIELLGSGYYPDSVPRLQPLPAFILTPPRPPL